MLQKDSQINVRTGLKCGKSLDLFSKHTLADRRTMSVPLFPPEFSNMSSSINNTYLQHNNFHSDTASSYDNKILFLLKNFSPPD